MNLREEGGAYGKVWKEAMEGEMKKLYYNLKN